MFCMFYVYTDVSSSDRGRFLILLRIYWRSRRRHVQENQPCNGALQREIQNTLHHLATSLIYLSRDAMYVGIHICETRLFPCLWHCLAMRKNVALSFMILSSWCPRTDADETGVRMPAEARESHIYVLFESTSKSIRIKLDFDPSCRSIRGWCCQMSQKRVANSVDNAVK